jgi:hypothetical protein
MSESDTIKRLKAMPDFRASRSAVPAALQEIANQTYRVYCAPLCRNCKHKDITFIACIGVRCPIRGCFVSEAGHCDLWESDVLLEIANG